MQWSPTQDNALREVQRWLRNPSGQQLFRMFGYAGTGKTSMARALAAGIDGQTFFAAYTGKAASVLRAAGCPGARTIHSLIYHPRNKSEARLRELTADLAKAIEAKRPLREIEELKDAVKKESDNLSRPSWQLNLDSELSEASLLVVDECSMVDEAMGKDILSFDVPVLVLGDPAQLPPVMGAGYFTEAKPDIMLTEIHRQAKDNPIIALATKVREGQMLPLGKYGDSEVKRGMGPEEAMSADQLLCGRNMMRHAMNRRIRELKGITQTLPVRGERVVCLRNDKQLDLLNGTLHRVVKDARDAGSFVNLTIREEGLEDNDLIDNDKLVTAHREYFEGGADKLSGYERLRAQEFDFGYTLTVHKAQGSQWRNVLLYDDWSHQATRQKWLYTGITRAQEKVTVVRE